MRILTLELIKLKCRIEPSMTEEDKLLEHYGNAAEETVLNYCNRSLESIYEEYGSIPAAIVEGCLLLVANSYRHGEPSSITNLYQVPYTFDAIVKPYMIL